MLVGHSYGADLIVHYAAENPDAVRELVLLDGANPIPAPFITRADLPEFLELWESSSTSGRVGLSGRQILELNLELDVLRSGIDLDIDVVGPGLIDRYRRIDIPISMIMSTSMAGHGRAGRTARHNRLWHAGVERLVRERPQTATTWLDATHALVVTHARQIARMIASSVRC
ncbi:alpha/beta fold hydrolase [Nocardia panacis]|uniref:alpha/beta fold hydrolase n=1 Tax=Nocardia panacis TaxID=2340916 RepID=UPI001EF14B3C|nr:alpha/beta hydrolase [Nocardia panacis]